MLSENSTRAWPRSASTSARQLFTVTDSVSVMESREVRGREARWCRSRATCARRGSAGSRPRRGRCHPRSSRTRRCCSPAVDMFASVLVGVTNWVDVLPAGHLG